MMRSKRSTKSGSLNYTTRSAAVPGTSTARIVGTYGTRLKRPKVPRTIARSFRATVKSLGRTSMRSTIWLIMRSGTKKNSATRASCKSGSSRQRRSRMAGGPSWLRRSPTSAKTLPRRPMISRRKAKKRALSKRKKRRTARHTMSRSRKS